MVACHLLQYWKFCHLIHCICCPPVAVFNCWRPIVCCGWCSIIEHSLPTDIVAYCDTLSQFCWELKTTLFLNYYNNLLQLIFYFVSVFVVVLYLSLYFFVVFSARQHIADMLSTLYAVARPSMRLSVRHTGGSYKNGWNETFTIR